MKSNVIVNGILIIVLGAVLWALIFYMAGCESITRNYITPIVEEETDKCLTRECCEEFCEDKKARWHPVRLECECEEEEDDAEA